MNRAGAIVGRNIRHLRQVRGLTVGEVAQAAGVSRATLTELEGGRGNPTVDTLATLAHALGAPVGELLVPAVGDVPELVPADGGPVIARGPVDFRLLHRLALTGAVVETWEARLHGGSRSGGPMPAGVLVTAYGVQGTAQVGPADAPIDLGAGDSVLYRADRTTVFGAEHPATVHLTVTYPPVSAARALSTGLAPDPD